MATKEMPYLKHLDLNSKEANTLRSVTQMAKRDGGVQNDRISRHVSRLEDQMP